MIVTNMPVRYLVQCYSLQPYHTQCRVPFPGTVEAHKYVKKLNRAHYRKVYAAKRQRHEQWYW